MHRHTATITASEYEAKQNTHSITYLMNIIAQKIHCFGHIKVSIVELRIRLVNKKKHSKRLCKIGVK